MTTYHSNRADALLAWANRAFNYIDIMKMVWPWYPPSPDLEAFAWRCLFIREELLTEEQETPQ